MRVSDAEPFRPRLRRLCGNLSWGGGGSCLDVAVASKARFTCCFDFFTRPNLALLAPPRHPALYCTSEPPSDAASLLEVLVPSCRTNNQPSVSREPVSLTQFDSSRPSPSCSAGGLEGAHSSCPVSVQQPQTDATPPATGHWPPSGRRHRIHAPYLLRLAMDCWRQSSQRVASHSPLFSRHDPGYLMFGAHYGWFIARRAGTDTAHARIPPQTPPHTPFLHCLPPFLTAFPRLW